MANRDRNLTLDLLRGYFLLVILIDHLARFPGLFDLLTGRGWLWASAAEGFFIISGMMVGLVRGRELKSRSFGTVWQKLWRRSLELYAWSVGLTLAFTAIGWHLGASAGVKVGLSPHMGFWGLVGNTLTLRYIYGWADFLPYYAVFMLAAPAALYLLQKRRGWLAVMTASAGLWLVRGQSFYLAWQLLFMGGITVGYYLPQIEARLNSWPAKVKRLWSAVLYAAAGTTLAASVLVVHVRPLLLNANASWLAALANALQRFEDFSEPWFDKWSLAPGRLLTALLWFTALYLVVRVYEAKVAKLGWLLLPLGRNCLFIYGVESAIIYAAAVTWPGATGWAANLAINTVAIAIIWGLAQLRSWQPVVFRLPASAYFQKKIRI